MTRLLPLILLLGCSNSGAITEPPPADDDDSTVAPDDDDATADDDDVTADDDDVTADDDDVTADDDDTVDDDDSPPPLLVNELCATNESTPDDLGGTSDWIEIFNPAAEPLPLQGLYISDDWTQPTMHPLPPGLTVPPSGHLVLWASGDASQGLRHLPFRLSGSGEAVGLFDAGGTSLDWVEFPALGADQAYARLPDGSPDWTIVDSGTPGAANADVHLESATLVAPGATWSYLDTGVDPGPDWADPAFDDSAWATGGAPLGYGDPMTTLVGFGPDAAAKYTTTWFRLAFPVTEEQASSAQTLALSLRVDDGALVRLDGQEILRVNLPGGDVTADTLATTAVGGPSEAAFATYALAAGALAAPGGVLAVEVHQASPSSSDLGFDLGLDVEWLVENTGN